MIYVLLPVYNEERGLASLLRRVRDTSRVSAERWCVLVVDDGSGDDTAQVARSFARTLDVWLVSHARNLGLGAALRTGIELVLEHASEPDDVLVTMDADDSHDPELVPELVRALRKRSADVAIASRFSRGGAEVGVPLARRALSRAAALCYRAVAPMPGVRDYSSGFRAVRVEALRAARAAAGGEIPREGGFTATVELLLRLRAVNATAAEVPLVVRYDRKASPSRMRLAATVGSAGALVARALVDRLRAVVAPPGTAALRGRAAAPGAPSAL
ncbi:MAG: glycosyltransferase family 2 protein [Gemmatimonadota bacterium]